MDLAEMKNIPEKAMFHRRVVLGSLILLIIGVNSSFSEVGVPYVNGKNNPSLDIDDYSFGSLTECPDIVDNDEVIACSNGVIYGTNHDDTILVKANINPATLVSTHQVFAKSSDDVVQGSDDDDMIFGQAGDDLLQGNIGNDQLDGGNGDDSLTGGFGADYLIGGDGADRLFGGTEDDILQGGSGADSFNCGEGVDTVVDFNASQGDTITEDCELVNE